MSKIKMNKITRYDSLSERCKNAIDRLLNKVDVEISVNNRSFGFAIRALHRCHSHANQPAYSFLIGYSNQANPSKNWFRSFTYHHRMWFHVFNNRFDDYDAISDGWDSIFEEFDPLIEISKKKYY